MRKASDSSARSQRTYSSQLGTVLTLTCQSRSAGGGIIGYIIGGAIIGVLARKGQNALGQDQDDIVLMPLSTARNRVLGQTQGRQKRIGTISVKTADGADMKAIENRIREALGLAPYQPALPMK